MGHDAKFYLRVIHGKQHLVRTSDECPTDLATQVGANWDVLQVRLRRSDAPGDRPSLVKGGVYPPGSWVNLQRESIDIGGFELGEFPIIQHAIHHRMGALQCLEDICSRGIKTGGGAAG